MWKSQSKDANTKNPDLSNDNNSKAPKMFQQVRANILRMNRKIVSTKR